eukprot:CAMPEP_0118855096 /NCGR_PEP_ID=MMETSP1163-20130328/3054_1 /TAXON_ID=124430 /ORGANISM="Phaeomonas parva, Strain CCMP2877" /LENGTH=83 /DNA_ID=CAMNT_0006787927 /DNA_START=134 /DNA_END=385 /DNA_ORIENTATION=+
MSAQLQGTVGGTAVADTAPALRAQLRELQRDNELVSTQVLAAEERVAQLQQQRRQLLELLHVCLSAPAPVEERKMLKGKQGWA